MSWGGCGCLLTAATSLVCSHSTWKSFVFEMDQGTVQPCSSPFLRPPRISTEQIISQSVWNYHFWHIKTVQARHVSYFCAQCGRCGQEKQEHSVFISVWALKTTQWLHAASGATQVSQHWFEMLTYTPFFLLTFFMCVWSARQQRDVGTWLQLSGIPKAFERSIPLNTMTLSSYSANTCGICSP